MMTLHEVEERVRRLLSADPELTAYIAKLKVRGGKKGYGKNFEVVVQIDYVGSASCDCKSPTCTGTRGHP